MNKFTYHTQRSIDQLDAQIDTAKEETVSLQFELDNKRDDGSFVLSVRDRIMVSISMDKCRKTIESLNLARHRALSACAMCVNCRGYNLQHQPYERQRNWNLERVVACLDCSHEVVETYEITSTSTNAPSPRREITHA